MSIKVDQTRTKTGAGRASQGTCAIVAAASVLALGVFRAPAWTIVHAGALGALQDGSVWDGVYTEEQAKRGADAYVDACAACHGGKLEGGETAPALVGGGFTNVWNGRTVGDFFARVSATMPDDNPGGLNPQQYADILARILQANKYPAGSSELGRETAALKKIRFQDKPSGK